MSDWTVETAPLMRAEREWDELHLRSAAPIFSSRRWLRVLSEVFGRDAHASLLRENGQLRAGIPLLLKHKGMLRYSGTLPGTLYSGLVHDFRGEDLQLYLPTLLAEIERTCHFASLSLPHDTMLIDMLGSRGWEIRRQLSLRLDISDASQLWVGYSQSLRRKIRRADEAQLTFSDDAPAGLLADMYQNSYQRHGLNPPTPPEHMRKWILALRREELLETFVAYRADGVPAAARAAIRDGDVVYDWLAGADPAVSPSASHWLLHSMLGRFSDQGARVLDFMGANTPGVVEFKRSFGPAEHPYIEANWYRSSLVKALSRLQTSRLARRRRM